MKSVQATPLPAQVSSEPISSWSLSFYLLSRAAPLRSDFEEHLTEITKLKPVTTNMYGASMVLIIELST